MLALQAFSENNAEKAREACHQEAEFDKLYWRTRTEKLRILERISDHADNLGVSVARSAA